jgi:hypothetical protein
MKNDLRLLCSCAIREEAFTCHCCDRITVLASLDTDRHFVFSPLRAEPHLVSNYFSCSNTKIRNRTMRLSLLLLAMTSVVLAADTPVDETLVDRPSKNIDFPGCFSDLQKADRNGDGFVKQNEYLNFIQEYGKRICFSTDALTLQQSATFNTLACICRNIAGETSDCCLEDNARIPTAGALSDARTPSQLSYLTTVCKLTDSTIDGQCPPAVRERDGPPLAALVAANNKTIPWWPFLLAGLLLALLLCCCCCVIRKKKMRQQEEEEEEEAQNSALKNAPPPMEQAPVGPPPGPHLLRKTGIDPEKGPVKVHDEENPAIPRGPGMGASGTADASDSDEDEEGRKKRGGGHIPGDENGPGLRIPTAPRLPPPEDPENPAPKLRPIPPKENEDDEWDHAGRNIDFPKDKDEMSAGEVDHYEPDGGVYNPERPSKEALDWKKDWNRQKPEEPDEVDPRKHRIQAGLGEGEVWDKLNQDETDVSKNNNNNCDVFDWVVQSALGALDNNQGPSKNV